MKLHRILSHMGKVPERTHSTLKAVSSELIIEPHHDDLPQAILPDPGIGEKCPVLDDPAPEW